MDSRIYFHQYRRPRHSNPTYVSSHMQNSMSFFNGGYYPEPAAVKDHERSYFIDSNTNRVRAAKPMPPVPDSYRPPREQSLPPLEAEPRQQNSKLSGIGQRSLQLDQVGVYHKQTSPYNIISCKPKEYSDDIRQYPWYSVENRDDVYYRRMNNQNNEEKFYSSRAKTHQKTPSENVVAGKHTYGLEPKISLNPEHIPAKERFTAKMLNHMDELQHNLA